MRKNEKREMGDGVSANTAAGARQWMVTAFAHKSWHNSYYANTISMPLQNNNKEIEKNTMKCTF